MSIISENGEKRAHRISIDGRERTYIEGVEEVMGFDEESVRLRSSKGELYIEGKDLRVDTLDTERGVVAVVGRLNGLYYASEEKDEKRGFLARLFR